MRAPCEKSSYSNVPVRAPCEQDDGVCLRALHEQSSNSNVQLPLCWEIAAEILGAVVAEEIVVLTASAGAPCEQPSYANVPIRAPGEQEDGVSLRAPCEQSSYTNVSMRAPCEHVDGVPLRAPCEQSS